MIGWLKKRFVHNFDHVDDPAVRTRYGLVASVACIVLNVLLCVGKAVVGLAAGSVSIVADAVNNLSDASSNIVSLFGFKLASKPADADHPYGHGRFEYLAALVVAALVLAIGINLMGESIAKVLNPEPTEFNAAVVAVLAASMAVKLWMMALNRSFGQAIGSEALEATAVDSRNDVISSGAVLLAALFSATSGIDLDGWAGLAVGAFVCWSGVELVRDAISPLLGRRPSAERVEHIREKILSYPGILGTHDLMVHDYGPGHQFASAHVEMAGDAGESPFEQHALIDRIEQDFKEDDGLIMTLHFDPIVTNDPTVRDMHHWISEAVRKINPMLTIHDLRVVPSPAHMSVLFDVVRPHDLSMSDEELCSRIDATVRGRYPRAVCKLTIDSDYVSAQQ